MDIGIRQYACFKSNIENTDIVLWHVFGLHHLPRTEDFPVQPCISTGFKLVPSGFHNQNPGIDLPPQVNTASKLAGHSHSCCA